MSNYEALYDECDRMIRAGQTQAAAQRLGKINTAQVPRAWRLKLARLSRRSGSIALGLRLLTPLVSENRRGILTGSPTPAERAEYAALLFRCGAVREALESLTTIDVKEAPDAALFSAFCLFSQWDYERAVPSLEAYLRHVSDPYASLIGKVNLSAALVSTGRYANAETTIGECLEQTRSSGASRLEANCLELSTQMDVLRGNLTGAEASLARAEEILGDARTHDQLFIRCWRAFLDARKTGNKIPLLEFRQEALRRKRHETVREADLLALMIDFDQGDFDYLYFGTPFEAFRDRMTRLTGRAPSGDTYRLGGAEANCFDIMTGFSNAGLALPQGEKIHQLIEILLRDFYRPMTTAGLFAALYPTERFNIFTSPTRVHQVVSRTRRWTDGSQAGFAVRCKGACYSLTISELVAFSLPKHRASVDTFELRVRQLRALQSTGFTARDASQTLGLSRSESRRVLEIALAQGVIEKYGAGPRTRYHFAA